MTLEDRKHRKASATEPQSHPVRRGAPSDAALALLLMPTLSLRRVGVNLQEAAGCSAANVSHILQTNTTSGKLKRLAVPNVSLVSITSSSNAQGNQSVTS